MFSETKHLFTLLAIAAVIAIIAGAYLGVALGLQGDSLLTVLSAGGVLLWAVAWGEFLAMCLRLRRDETAFTPASGQTLQIISLCMAGLAAVTLLAALLGGERADVFLVIDAVLLPGLFLAVGVAARILRGLLIHAMALETEQEGVV